MKFSLHNGNKEGFSENSPAFQALQILRPKMASFGVSGLRGSVGGRRNSWIDFAQGLQSQVLHDHDDAAHPYDASGSSVSGQTDDVNMADHHLAVCRADICLTKAFRKRVLVS